MIIPIPDAQEIFISGYGMAKRKKQFMAAVTALPGFILAQHPSGYVVSATPDNCHFVKDGEYWRIQDGELAFFFRGWEENDRSKPLYVAFFPFAGQDRLYLFTQDPTREAELRFQTALAWTVMKS